MAFSKWLAFHEQSKSYHATCWSESERKCNFRTRGNRWQRLPTWTCLADNEWAQEWEIQTRDEHLRHSLQLECKWRNMWALVPLLQWHEQWQVIDRWATTKEQMESSRVWPLWSDSTDRIVYERGINKESRIQSFKVQKCRWHYPVVYWPWSG